MRRLNLTLTVILAEALACFLIWSNFAPDHHITAAHSLASGVVALIASMVSAFSADRIGLNVIEYVVDGVLAATVANILLAVSRGTSLYNLFPLQIAVRGIAWVGGVPGIALVNAGKREIV